MTDALITRLGQSRQIVVRPTSAVRRYTDPQQDPVAAGRQHPLQTPQLIQPTNDGAGRPRETSALQL